MMQTRKTRLIGVALAACLGAAGLAVAGGSVGKDAYEAARDRIATHAKAERKACDRFKGNAHDVCDAQAKGREKIARAELEAKYKPGPEAEKLAKNARADADYDLAKLRCEGGTRGSPRDRCLDQARIAHEAAIRLAKVEKVQALNALKAKAAEQRHAAHRGPPNS